MTSAPPPLVSRRIRRFSNVIADCRVLVVDDNAFSREMLGAYLAEAGLTNIGYAADGYQALDMTRAERPDLLILDIMMPGLDGFEVCRALRADPQTAELPIIIQTALTSADNRNMAFSSGATDLIPKPIDPNELIARVRIHLEKRQLIADLRHFRMRVENELDIARSMFGHLLPSSSLCREVEKRAGVFIRHQVLTGEDVCGDLWGLTPLENGRFGVFLADIPGRGLSAALRSFRLHTLLREAAPSAAKPAAFLKEINERMNGLHEPGEHALLVYAVVDTAEGTIVYATAAAPNPTVLAGGMRCIEGEGSGLPIGIKTDVEYREWMLPFPPGSALLLYSNAVLDTLPKRHQGLCSLLQETILKRGRAEAFAQFSRILRRSFASSPVDDHTLIWIDHPTAVPP